MIKILAVVIPLLLFLLKYEIPKLAEEAYTGEKSEKEQIIIELLHYPVDLLFISIGYAFPKIVEVVMLLKEYAISIEKCTDDNAEMLQIYLSEQTDAVSQLSFLVSISIFILFLVPFFVLLTKVNEKKYFNNNKKRCIINSILLYIISIVFIILIVFR